MKKKSFIIILITGITLITLAAGSGVFIYLKTTEEKPPVVKQKEETLETESNKKIEAITDQIKPVATIPVVPASYLLKVPYTVQAPYRNWNIHQESCEEAAILMIDYYLKGQSIDIIPQSTANQELLEMVAWQKANWGSEWDLNLTTLGKLANEYYGYKPEVKKNITANDIKLAVSQKKPVLVPVITHGLENPNYGATPTYHILLIKGYDAKGVITNDAGVSKGRNWYYTWQILWQAIDAQTAKMKQGRDMLTITK